MQHDLFSPGEAPSWRRPQHKRRVLMALVDAGYVDGMGDAAQWRCRKCGHDSGWIPAPTKAAPPCPRCTEPATAPV